MKSLFPAGRKPDLQERTLFGEDRQTVRRAQSNKSSMTWRDFAWSRMDTNKNLMVINSILLFEGPLDMERLVSTIAHRLPNYSRFTQKVVTRMGRPYWVEDDAFDIRNHIKLEKMGPGVSRQDLQNNLTTLAHVPLEENRPLWHMSVIDKVENGFAIVFRVQHCITDGLGLVHVLNHLTDDNDCHGQDPAAEGHPHHATPVVPSVCSQIASCLTWLKIAGHITRLAFLLPDIKTPFKAPLKGDKKLVWLPPLAMDQVRTMAKRMGVTLNDVWVAAVSTALRQYFAERKVKVDRGPVRAAVTFNLREKANAFQLGNEFGLVAVELPTDLADPLQRLRESSQRMTAIKKSQQPRATMAFLSIAGWLPMILQRFALNLFTSKGSVVLTNIEGPAKSRYLAGSKLTDLICWVPQAGMIGVGLAFISYAEQIQLALFVDTEMVDSPDRLMALTCDAFAELDKATRTSVDVAPAPVFASGLPVKL